jgi:hypothetical protein
MKLIMENWRKLLNENKLRVFDFDDTLVQTDSTVVLHKANGEVVEQTPGEWAVYKPERGDEFDFSEFRGQLKNPREIKDYMDVLRRVLGAGGNRRTAILTARGGSGRNIMEFLDELGVDTSGLEIIPLGSSDPQAKAEWIEDQIEQGYDDIFFMDDSSKNIAVVQALEEKYPEVKVRTQQV